MEPETQAQSFSVEELIPQRPPFQMVDEILELTETRIRTRKTFPETESFYRGHFPFQPITPGMYLCECVHQAGAALIKGGQKVDVDGIPVLVRIYGTKFKGIVPPGATVETQVDLTEVVGGVFWVRGQVWHDGRKVLDHRCSLGMVVDGALTHDLEAPKN